MIKYNCSFCGEAMESPGDLAGQADHCPSCGQWNKVLQAESKKTIMSIGKSIFAGITFTGDDFVPVMETRMTKNQTRLTRRISPPQKPSERWIFVLMVSLAGLRDMLLPKLQSGEIELPAAEVASEAVQ